MSRPDARLAIFIGLFFLAVILFSLSAHVLADPDTYWHIGAGRWMLAHGTVPTTDPFSNSISGARWVPHEWLSDVIFAGVFRWWGWSGIVLIASVAAAMSLALLAYFASRWLDPLLAAITTGLGYMMLADHLLARPHIMAMPLMIAFIGGLVVAREQRRPPSLWLLPAMTLWANLHGAFTLGVGFAGYFAAEALWQDGWRHGRRWLVFFGVTLAAGLLTPNGINGLLILREYFTDQSFAMSMITEWQSPNFQSPQPMEIWLLGFLLFCLTIGIRVPATRLIILLALLHLALQHTRNIELIGLLAPLVLLPSTAPQIYSALGRDFHHVRISPLLMRSAMLGAACSLVLFFAAGHDRKDDAISPIAAVEAARSAGLTGPVLNSYGFGGYLIFSGISPFIDGRSEMYGDAFIKQFVEAEYGADVSNLTRLIAKYHLDWALLRPGETANLMFSELPNWRKVYSDEYAVVWQAQHRGGGT